MNILKGCLPLVFSLMAVVQGCGPSPAATYSSSAGFASSPSTFDGKWLQTAATCNGVAQTGNGQNTLVISGTSGYAASGPGTGGAPCISISLNVSFSGNTVILTYLQPACDSSCASTCTQWLQSRPQGPQTFNVNFAEPNLVLTSQTTNGLNCDGGRLLNNQFTRTQ